MSRLVGANFRWRFSIRAYSAGYKRQNTWHWGKTCSNYPNGADVEKSNTKPTTGEIDNECKAKELEGICKE